MEISENEKKQIIALWNSGIPTYQVLRTLPCCARTGAEILKKLKNDGTLMPRRTMEETVADICAAYQSGEHDLQKLSFKFGKVPSTIRVYLWRGGIKRPRQKQYKKSRETKNATTISIMDDIQGGKKKMVDIAKKYGVSRQRVYKIRDNMRKRWVTDDE